ncbi:UrcA family protein [Parvularcula lutaonensis]|uniref:UrcA family protein n=1 Tax=Parvularcula lutaonensis TaxID=491923 RepID=A0ABV7ME56_9PROT|nr:UrcA family protein [Parvularcula lutaonensis]GGY54679.1 hypothetical protein GCM10007148_25480 [Parvularcula lutaonensis]
MLKFKTFIPAAAALAAIGFMAAPAQAEELDTFAIDVVLEELASADAAEAFEKRLWIAAREYCEDNYIGSDRRALEGCTAAVVAAVQDQIAQNAASEGVQVAWID